MHFFDNIGSKKERKKEKRAEIPQMQYLTSKDFGTYLNIQSG